MSDLQKTIEEQRAEIERLRQRLLTATGDDLCRLTQEEIWKYTSGTVQIPPKEEFLASCERFHAQVAKESGVNENCLTLAQLIAENERLRSELAAERARFDYLAMNRKAALTATDPAMAREMIDEKTNG